MAGLPPVDQGKPTVIKDADRSAGSTVVIPYSEGNSEAPPDPLPDRVRFNITFKMDGYFLSGYPMTGMKPPPRPVITPKLQTEFTKFIFGFDLSKEQTTKIPVAGGKLRLEVSIRPSDNKIMVWIFANDKDGALATLTADGTGKLTSLTDAGLEVSNLTRETATLYYDQSPSLPMRDALIEAFHIPPVTADLREREASAHAAREAHEARLATIKPTQTRIREVTGDHPKSVEVLQHEFTITRPGNDRSPFLQTFGAGPCVVLTLYDKRTKTGLLAHLDATTDVAGSFGQMAANLARHGVDIGNMEARIIGGQTGQSEELILKLRDQLGDRNVRIVEQDIVESSYDVSAVVLDTNTGEL